MKEKFYRASGEEKIATLAQLVEDLEERVEDLESRVQTWGLAKEISDLRRHVVELTKLVEEQVSEPKTSSSAVDSPSGRNRSVR